MLPHKESPRRAWLLALVAVAAGLAPARANSLEQELIAHAPALLNVLKDKGCANVGVLKFRVWIGEKPVADQSAVFTLDVADRLAVALVLADDLDNPIGVIRNAGAVVKAKLPTANWRAEEKGRRELFKQTYPLAWGDEMVKPNGFLTGNVHVDKDLRAMAVQLQYIDPDGGMKEMGDPIRADTNSGDLPHMGLSFLLRTVEFDDKGGLKLVPDADGKPPDAKAQETGAIVAAQKEQDNPASFPLLKEADAPVELAILYDGKSVPLKIDDGKAVIPQPAGGQKVVLQLKRREGVNARFGVVLKVNGLNTLYKERLPELHCRKWLLLNDEPLSITGFQISGGSEGKEEPFTVLSESASQEVEAGSPADKDLGTITLTVFREKQSEERVVKVTGDAGAVLRGFLPAPPRGAGPDSVKPDENAPWPANVGLLRQQLLLNTQPPHRGFIQGGGPAGTSPTREESFDPHPTPVLCAVVTYRAREPK